MKNKILLAFLAQFLLHTCFGQQFSFQGNSPFGIQTTSGTMITQRIMFYDYDGDGDLDLFQSGMGAITDFDNLTWENMPYFIDYQENIGDKSHPQFGPRVTAFNGNFPFPTGFFFPSIGDLNMDGKVDFIISANVDYIGNRTAVYYKNLHHAGTDDFEQVSFLDLDLPDFVPESFFVPELTDLDHDGDLDILMSGINPAFMEEDGPDVATYYYAKNIGTAQVPEFSGWYENPYGLIPNPLIEITTSGDIDNDGDTDILGALTGIPADSMNYIYFHKNTPGPNGKPSFTTVTNSPFGLPQSFGKDQFFSPQLVDINGDGDLDFFVLQGTTSNNVLKYFENNLCSSVVMQTDVDLCEGDSLVVGGNSYFESGDYSLSLEGPNGCDTLLLLTINIIPIYSSSINESICEGETYTIGTESFNSTGVYTVLFTSSNGCDSIVSLNLNIITVDNSLTISENILTANQSGASYQWINCDTGIPIAGATNQSYSVISSGNYSVNILDASGCSAVSPCTSVLVNGTIDQFPANSLMIYPNPANGLITIQNDSPFSISDISVINLSGQSSGDIKLNGTGSADISFLAKGFYFVKIKINGLEIIRKLIVI